MVLNDEVLVAGAGPAGSATAIGLARSGCGVTLIDRSRFPRDKCCSEYGSPGTVAELRRLGMLDELVQAGLAPLSGTRVVGAAGSELLGRFRDADPAPNQSLGMALPRLILDRLLVDAARRAGVRVIESTRCLAARRDGELIRLDLESDGRRLAATGRVVVAADGLRSRIAGPRIRRRHAPRRLAFVAHFSAVSGMSDVAELHAGNHGYIGLNPLGGGLTNVAVVVRADLARAAAGRVDEFARERLAEQPLVSRRVEAGTLVRHWMATGPFDMIARRPYGDGIVAVGDAADFLDPFTGEGIWSALVGARLAVDLIREALSRPGAVTAGRLRRYRRDRIRAFAAKWVLERLIAHALDQPRFFDHCIERIERRGMAATLIGATAELVPRRKVLNPFFLTRMVA